MDEVPLNEATIRMVFFIGILLAVALMEIVVPRRTLNTSKKSRWFGNLGIVVVNTFAIRFIFPTTAVGLAVWAKNQGWGIFNTLDLPFWLAVTLSVVLLDFVIYLQHVMFHAVPRALASPYDAPRGHGLRFNHRYPVSPYRNYHFYANQVFGHHRPWGTSTGSPHLRNRSQWRRHVQPWEFLYPDRVRPYFAAALGDT